MCLGSIQQEKFDAPILLFPPRSALRKEARYRGPRPPLTPRHLLRPVAFSTLPGLPCAYHLSLTERSYFRNNGPHPVQRIGLVMASAYCRAVSVTGDYGGALNRATHPGASVFQEERLTPDTLSEGSYKRAESRVPARHFLGGMETFRWTATRSC